ncbi:MAG TPA: helix-turn-helix transcriptional regulator [Capsulimonadaceae bacterium]|nr:helix-turn-helix transcriptional regulator [Capsulimonadaceae bacterium]
MKVMLKTHEVKRELARRNISQNGLAIKLGITSGYCSQLLAGVRCPSPALRSKLMGELRLPFETLFSFAEPSSANQ